MRSFGPILLVFVVMGVIAIVSGYPNWNVDEKVNAYGDDLDEFDQEYTRLQKRFLLGLGLTKNNPGKEIFFTSGSSKKPYHQL